MSTRAKWAIGIGLAVLIAIIVFASWKKQDAAKTTVTVQKVERKDLRSLVTATGKIEAHLKVDLSANVMGQIVNLAVREGDSVKKKDFLLQIDQTQLKASAQGAEESLKALFFDRDAARAGAEQARKTFERTQSLFASKLLSPSDLDRDKAAADGAESNEKAIERRIEQSRAALAGANDSLAKTKIVSPIDGIVTALPVEEGEIAVIGTMNNAGTKLMTISDMGVVEAVMEVDETDIPRVRIGQTADVRIDAYHEEKFAGVVTEVGSSPIATLGGNQAVNFEVKIRLEHPPQAIRPGFSCSADILTGTREKAVAVPIQALVVKQNESTKKDEEGVFRYDRKSNQVHFSKVVTGLTGETDIEVASGVAESDEVVTGPFRALRDLKDADHVKLEKPKPKETATSKEGSG